MRIASCRAEGRQAQRFRHGGAGTIQPGKGHPQLAHGVITGGALGLQIPREGKLHLLFGNARFAQAMAGTALLQHAFGLLPAGAALGIKARILHQLIKALCQRAFALFFAAHGGPGRQHRRVREYYGIAPSYRHNRQSPFRFVWA